MRSWINMKLLCLVFLYFSVKHALAQEPTQVYSESDDVISEESIAELITSDLQENEQVETDASLENTQLNASIKSLENVTASVSGNKTKFFPVTCKERAADEPFAVKLVNDSVLLNIIIPTSNKTANECVLVIFYAPWCHFCAAAAPHYNALARLYPTIHVLAINAIKYHSLNTRYGTVAVPNVLLFHNGRAITKYNETLYSLEKFSKFVTKYTGLNPVGAVNVTSADFEGPLPSEPIYEIDYILWFSWFFMIFCCVLGFTKSPLCHYILESVRNNWLEAEAQHEHED